MHVLLVNRMVENSNLNKRIKKKKKKEKKKGLSCVHLIEFKVKILSDIC